jgi:RNA polymerase-interacting CarD/CdnL/TRCF family regulator
MSEKIRIQPLADHEYAVDVTEGTTHTRHRVMVPVELLDDLGLVDVDEQRVVRESIEFLLEREPATSIYDEFPLDTVASRFPDFADELRTRLSA